MGENDGDADEYASPDVDAAETGAYAGEVGEYEGDVGDHAAELGWTTGEYP